MLALCEGGSEAVEARDALDEDGEQGEELFEVVTRMQADNVTVLPVRRGDPKSRGPASR